MGLRRFFKNRFKKKIVEINEVSNLYKTSYKKNVLISYIVPPFVTQNHFKHQNYITAHIIAESFSKMGYNVDVVDYQTKGLKIKYHRYDVIFGFGYAFERSFYYTNLTTPKIYFNTGAHPDLHNEMSLKSLEDFYDLSGNWLPDEANISDDHYYFSLFYTKSSIILARGYIFDDFKSRFPNRLYSLNNNTLGIFNDFPDKTTAQRKAEFLFLSGAKLLTKGLPLLLEVAKIRPELKFHVVVRYIDDRLIKQYEHLLGPGTNVNLYVDVRMDSEEMKNIISSCSYCVAPSYIDGFPGGTIEPMSAGLIPIVSKYCGFPSREFIFEMESLSVEDLNSNIDRVLALDEDKYLEYSNAARNYISSEFSKESVEEQLTHILNLELNSVDK